MTEQSTEIGAVREHVLKVSPDYFDALYDGSKTFEVRRNDRGFQRGDTLVLWEYNSDQHGGGFICSGPGCYAEHRSIRRTVSYVYSGDPRWPALQPGYVVLGLGEVRDA